MEDKKVVCNGSEKAFFDATRNISIQDLVLVTGKVAPSVPLLLHAHHSYHSWQQTLAHEKSCEGRTLGGLV